MRSSSKLLYLLLALVAASQQSSASPLGSAFSKPAKSAPTTGCHFGPKVTSAGQAPIKLVKSASAKSGSSRWVAKNGESETWTMTAAPKGAEVQISHAVVDKEAHQYVATMQVQTNGKGDVPKGAISLGKGLYEVYLYFDATPGQPENCYISTFGPTIKTATIESVSGSAAAASPAGAPTTPQAPATGTSGTTTVAKPAVAPAAAPASAAKTKGGAAVAAVKRLLLIPSLSFHTPSVSVKPS